MTTTSNDLTNVGAEVVKETVKLDVLTQEFSNQTELCQETEDEVASWITAIGKAILSIFK